jgi:putative transposase
LKKVLDPSGIRIRSFTLTPSCLSICYSIEVQEAQPIGSIGVDRNLSNLTIGNQDQIVQYNLSRAVEIAENSRSVVRAMKRNDVRIRKQLLVSHGRRRKNRINQLLHRVSKAIVQHAKEKNAAVIFEDIKHIRNLYRRGNHQGRDHRARMNVWPFYELKRQTTYKAQWAGIPVVELTKSETGGTSSLCPRCGKRTQVAARNDIQHRRQLWCEICKRWLDRDIIAAMNIARKGLLRFGSPQGAASEAMVQESGRKEPVILKVDAAKLGLRTRRSNRTGRNQHIT